MIIFDVATIVVYGLLSASILAVWLPHRYDFAARVRPWTVLLTASAAAGLYYGIVKPGGVLYLAALAACCYPVERRGLPVILRCLSACAVVVMTAALFLHKVPLFNNPLVFDGFALSERSSAYNKFWNYDKAAAGLVLLAWFGDICRSGRDWRVLARKSSVTALITVSAALSLALMLRYIEPDITFTTIYFAWAWANLFFTCVSEEMLFRGFLQKQLSALTERRPYRIGIVIFVGLLFGLAHAGGGTAYAMAATVAGIGYGYAYHASGRIEAAILTHFLLNSAHFVFFTYPYAKGVL